MRRADARAILARYPDAVAGRRLYRRLRLARAGYDAIERLVPRAGVVVDLGAGEGLLAHVLVRAGPDRRVIAVDHHPGRVARLTASAKGLPLEARLGDFTTIELPPCDAVLLVDVLHYLDRARPGGAPPRRGRGRCVPAGCLLLRDPDAGAGWKFAWNRLHELAATTLGLTRATIGAYRTGGAWVALLADLGLADARAGRRRFLTPYADRVVTAVRGPGLRERPASAGPPVPVAPPSAAFGPACLVCGAYGRHEILVHPEGRLTRCRRAASCRSTRCPRPRRRSRATTPRTSEARPATATTPARRRTSAASSVGASPASAPRAGAGACSTSAPPPARSSLEARAARLRRHRRRADRRRGRAAPRARGLDVRTSPVESAVAPCARVRRRDDVRRARARRRPRGGPPAPARLARAGRSARPRRPRLRRVVGAALGRPLAVRDAEGAPPLLHPSHAPRDAPRRRASPSRRSGSRARPSPSARSPAASASSARWAASRTPAPPSRSAPSSPSPAPRIHPYGVR